LHTLSQFLFLSVLPTAAVVLTAAFLAAAALLATVVVVVVVVAVVFFGATFFPLTIVVPLLPALASLLLPASEVGCGAFLAPARLVFPARLTAPARLIAPARGIVFFSGEEDLKGAGGAGRVRELLSRGERTPAGVVPGTAAFRVGGRVRVALEFAVVDVVVVGLERFLGLGSSCLSISFSFSLSVPSWSISSLVLVNRRFTCYGKV
jgi:hypothetical protein